MQLVLVECLDVREKMVINKQMHRTESLHSFLRTDPSLFEPSVRKLLLRLFINNFGGYHLYWPLSHLCTFHPLCIHCIPFVCTLDVRICAFVLGRFVGRGRRPSSHTKLNTKLTVFTLLCWKRSDYLQ